MLECIPDRRRTHSECSDDLVQPEDGDDDESSPKVRKMEAPKSGTKWHNPPDAKKWFEAKTGDGTIYFWHVESHGKLFYFIICSFFNISKQPDLKWFNADFVAPINLTMSYVSRVPLGTPF